MKIKIIYINVIFKKKSIHKYKYKYKYIVSTIRMNSDKSVSYATATVLHPLTKKPRVKADALVPVPLSRDSIKERRELCGIGGSPVGSPGRATGEKKQRGRSNSSPTTPSEINVAKSGKKEQTNSLFRTKPYVEKNEKIWLHAKNSLFPKAKKDLPTITRESPF